MDEPTKKEIDTRIKDLPRMALLQVLSSPRYLLENLHNSFHENPSQYRQNRRISPE
jgi:hypothetical protein